jgi:predicted chitinase
MIISPPFLPTRAAGMTNADYFAAAMPPATVNCPGTSVPEGSFPVSLKLGWHGGTHLHALGGNLGVLPIRAIADGEIVYARLPTVPVADATHALNYNPYGETAAWTDDGIVIIRHRTDIGTGANAEAIEFYSLFAHLSALSGKALKVAKGTATNEEKHIYRKDEIGKAGKIYNAADHVQVEILCDDANLQKLMGRANGKVIVTADGRTDAVYGEVYFRVPAGAHLHGAKPAGNVIVPTSAVAETTTADLIIGMRYANGDGPAGQRGSAWMTTYHPNGQILGDSLEDHNADYDLYNWATTISQAYPAGRQPAPSAVYEMLRFGRVIDSTNETLTPADCPHWRQVRGNAGIGWINLNTSNINRFSDSDFPDWKGWKIIDDDINDDGRAQSASLTTLIEDVSNAEGRLTPDELQQRMSLPPVRAALTRCICKFPSEWNRDTIDARWGWLKTDPDYGIVGEDWDKLRTHIAALTLPAINLPPVLASAHWHFQPQAFISHFTSCGWLSQDEMSSTLPKHLFYTESGNPRTAIVTNNNIYTLSKATASDRLTTHHVGLNKCFRKYLGASRQRIAYFLAQVILETAQWRNSGGMRRLMHEWFFGQHSSFNPQTDNYTAFYGRGIMQLTWAGNYKSYGEFRNFPVHNGPYVERLTLGSPRITATSQHHLGDPAGGAHLITWSPRFDPDIVGEDPYNACDSGGFYWMSKHFSGHININRVCDLPYSTESTGSINRLVNGGGNGYYERQAYTAYLMRYLTDDISNDEAVMISPPSPKHRVNVNFRRP